MRIFGITIPDEKKLQYGLTVFYGIGQPRARALLKEANVDHLKKGKDLSTEEEAALRKLIEPLTLEGDLRREIGQNIKRLKDIQSYRGSRHSRGLPVRGQRTKTNSRTVRGNKRVTMTSGRKTVEKK